MAARAGSRSRTRKVEVRCPLAVTRLSVNLAFGATVSGNVIQGNDFGTQGARWSVSPKRFIYGGGNACAPPDVIAAAWVYSGGGSHESVANRSLERGNLRFLMPPRSQRVAGTQAPVDEKIVPLSARGH